MSEFSPIWGGNEEYRAGDDVKQEKALALSVRQGGHNRPQCGRFQESKLTLLQRTKTAIDAVSSKSTEKPRNSGIFNGADFRKGDFEQ